MATLQGRFFELLSPNVAHRCRYLFPALAALSIADDLAKQKEALTGKQPPLDPRQKLLIRRVRRRHRRKERKEAERVQRRRSRLLGTSFKRWKARSEGIALLQQLAAARQRTKAAATVQRCWRSPRARARCVREVNRRRRAAHAIRAVWKVFARRKALARARARVDAIMAPHRRKRAEVFREGDELEAMVAEEEAARAFHEAERSRARKEEEATGEEDRSARAVTTAEAEVKEVADRAELESRVLRAVTEALRKNRITSADREEATEKEAALTEMRSRLQLPSATKRTVAKREALVPHPLQLLDGQLLLYRQDDLSFGDLMGQVKGWTLHLGVAPVWGGGVVRAGEELAVASGFSAAFGPLVLERAFDKVFSRGRFFDGPYALPESHVSYMSSKYWEEEVALFDATERFFRLVSAARADTITRAELRPFVLAMAQRHPDLASLSLEGVDVYVDSVLTTVFYKHSDRGVLRLRDIRETGLVTSFNAVARLEDPLQTSDYFSLSRYQTIHNDYLALQGTAARGVGFDSLKWYQHRGGTAVGPWRASRVLDAGFRPPSDEHVTSEGAAVRRGYGQPLDYRAWLCFALCEEAVRAGKCSGRDLRYCFELMDETGSGRVGLEEATATYENMEMERIRSGEEDTDFPPVQHVMRQYFDAMGVEPDRSYIGLRDVLKPENATQAGRFFQEMFAGLDIDDRFEYIVDGVDEGEASSPPSPTVRVMAPPDEIPPPDVAPRPPASDAHIGGISSVEYPCAPPPGTWGADPLRGPWGACYETAWAPDTYADSYPPFASAPPQLASLSGNACGFFHPPPVAAAAAAGVPQSGFTGCCVSDGPFLYSTVATACLPGVPSAHAYVPSAC